MHCVARQYTIHRPNRAAFRWAPLPAGNICRSPTAEAMFRAVVERNGLTDRFDIDSCGTGGGSPSWYREGGFSYHEGDESDPRMTATGEREPPQARPAMSGRKQRISISLAEEEALWLSFPFCGLAIRPWPCCFSHNPTLSLRLGPLKMLSPSPPLCGPLSLLAGAPDH